MSLGFFSITYVLKLDVSNVSNLLLSQGRDFTVLVVQRLRELQALLSSITN